MSFVYEHTYVRVCMCDCFSVEICFGAPQHVIKMETQHV